MIDPVSRTAGPAPAPSPVERPARGTAPAAPVSAASSRPEGEPAASAAPAVSKPEPLSLDVTQSEGVFVYTLRDPATDTIVAVIPREAVRTDRVGGKVDQRV